jgi:hypothetical protein
MAPDQLLNGGSAGGAGEHDHDADYEPIGAAAAAVADLVDSSPAALDTLNELAAALGDDANFATTVTTALAAKADALVAANTQTDSYTLVLADAGKVVEMNKATANNLTIPLNSSVAFSVGTVIELFQLGAGQTTVVATGGVTIQSPDGKLKLTGQYSGASLRKRATDTWSLVGDISA